MLFIFTKTTLPAHIHRNYTQLLPSTPVIPNMGAATQKGVRGAAKCLIYYLLLLGELQIVIFCKGAAKYFLVPKGAVNQKRLKNTALHSTMYASKISVCKSTGTKAAHKLKSTPGGKILAVYYTLYLLRHIRPLNKGTNVTKNKENFGLNPLLLSKLF
jgi:hypothetical protein